MGHLLVQFLGIIVFCEKNEKKTVVSSCIVCMGSSFWIVGHPYPCNGSNVFQPLKYGKQKQYILITKFHALIISIFSYSFGKRKNILFNTRLLVGLLTKCCSYLVYTGSSYQFDNWYIIMCIHVAVNDSFTSFLPRVAQLMSLKVKDTY